MKGKTMRAHCRLIASVIISLGLLAGAQSAGAASGSLSLDEAIDVTEAMAPGAFKAPPRTIDDITRVLNQKSVTPPEETQRRIAAADAEPPETRKAKKLLRFYVKRGTAARQIGRLEQAMDDLKKAVSYSKKAKMGPKKRSHLLLKLGFAQGRAGRYRKARKTMLRVTELNKYNPAAHRTLVSLAANAGDLEELKKVRAEGKAITQRMMFRRGITPGEEVDLRINYARMEASYYKSIGKWRDAERVVRQAIAYHPDSYKAKSNPELLSARYSDLADVLARQGRLAEAEIAARTSLLDALETLGRDNIHTAGSARMLANVLFAQGRYKEAEILVRESIDIQIRMGTPPDTGNVAKARRTLISVLIAQENWESSVKEFDELNTDIKKRGKEYRRMFLRRPDVAMALLRVGRGEEARGLLEAAVEDTRRRLGKKHFDTAIQAGLLAAVQTKTGNPESALEGFQSSVPILLSRSRRSEEGSDAFAVGRLIAFILEAYIEALASQNGGKPSQETVGEAFRMAEAARGQSVQRALGASGARAAVDDPKLADLARREQDAQKQIATLFAMLSDVLNTPADQRDDSALESLRKHIGQLRDARAALMQAIEKEFPDYAELINPKPATLGSARASLTADEALISTYVGADRTFIWGVPKNGDALFAVVEMGREDVADLVGLLRAALEPNVQDLSEVPPFDVEIAHDLFNQLLAPVKPAWEGAKRLVVAAHGPLGYLPLSVLPTGPSPAMADGGTLFAGYRKVPWLARTHAVTVVPSVASLKTLRSLPAVTRQGQAFVGFGDPVFNWDRVAADENANGDDKVVLRAAPQLEGLADVGFKDLPRLTDTADEIRAIAKALGTDPARNVHVRGEASEDRVKSMPLADYRIIAFATHGLIPGELGGLTEPALALSAPKDSGATNDGLLTMNEILGLKLKAEWVVLSACNTASGEGAGAEAVSGLGRAFFYAGTRALLVSNWPVQTTSARVLTTGIFKRQAEKPDLPRAEALRGAMLELIDSAGMQDESGKMRFSYAHPMFWAPFSLIGDGG